MDLVPSVRIENPRVVEDRAGATNQSEGVAAEHDQIVICTVVSDGPSRGVGSGGPRVGTGTAGTFGEAVEPRPHAWDTRSGVAVVALGWGAIWGCRSKAGSPKAIVGTTMTTTSRGNQVVRFDVHNFGQ
jgi:hypothetical protein